ncbi:hypothetical protein [Flammeovirga pacifica]|uniref:Uncharacterized protein n=1 Tax=Flammeovirga pacifica TaxID=915059 RepID=A0A1S1Z292_FLAPC|nr:hypothetical protein [Flammeovirga pacifica]OHX67390.1 hypothetical protein NH26_14065 [Flammeovirga pacifica]
MAIGILIFTLFAIFHFVYEGIILPNKRLEYRYKLFALRDQLRVLKSNNEKELNDELFLILDDSISTTIQYLPYFSLSFLRDAEKILNKDDKYIEIVEERKKKFNNCKIEEFHEIKNKLSDYSFDVLAFNSGGWLPIGFPVYLLGKVFHSLAGIFKEMKEFSKNIPFSSEKEFKRLDHSSLVC